MASRFLREFATRVPLNDIERGVLAAVDVRSDEDIDSLLRSVPSLADIGVRVPFLSAAVEGNLSPDYRDAVAIWSNRPESFKFGAMIPSDARFPLGSAAPTPRPSTTLPSDPPVLPTEPSPSKIDLRLRSWPVRNQAERGTCVAFGATACIEHYRAHERTSVPDYSEQFLYWAIKCLSNDPRKNKDGTFLRFARDMLQRFGICMEETWKYVETLVDPVSGQTQTDPSENSKNEALATTHARFTYAMKPSRAADKVLSLLQKGRPVAVSLGVYGRRSNMNQHNWNAPVALNHGHIQNPYPGTEEIAGHCVCITGFDPDGESGGGDFIFRNSWGTTSFAFMAPSPPHKSPEKGYGYLSASYVDKYCVEILQC